jgi:hypothetical protein
MARPFTVRLDGVVVLPRKAVKSADAGAAVRISRRQETGSRTQNLRIRHRTRTANGFSTRLTKITEITKPFAVFVLLAIVVMSRGPL